ncbi:MAG: threonine/serine exporter family protein [Clostridia bacterium]|nr:threonine/serine exporter family protein [Clostridia bacterium]
MAEIRQKPELSELLHLFLDIAEAIHRAGGEIYRVEDTVSRLGAAYGAIRTDVFVITSQIEVTMVFPGEIELTRSRRIRGGGTDLCTLEALNALSRRLCATPLPPAEVREELKRIHSSGRRLPIYLGSALAAGSFAIFFGGRVTDGIVGALFGLLICFLQEKLPPLLPNQVAVYFLAALVTGGGVCALSLLFPALLPDKVMIGDIMLLIPGIALTTAIRNILVGDTMSGILRLTESVVYAAALAGGFMIAMQMLPADALVGAPDPLAAVQLVTGALGSLGFALIFRLPKKYLPLAVLGGLLNWGSYLLLFMLTERLFLSCLLATMLTSLYAELLARRLRAPATLFIVPAVIPSIPGSCLYYTLQAAVGGDFATVREKGILTLLWAFGIAGGISLVVVLFAMARALHTAKKVD